MIDCCQGGSTSYKGNTEMEMVRYPYNSIDSNGNGINNNTRGGSGSVNMNDNDNLITTDEWNNDLDKKRD